MKTLNKKEILEAVIKATVDCFPKYSDGYCSAAYTKDGYIDVFYYRNWDRN